MQNKLMIHRFFPAISITLFDTNSKKNIISGTRFNTTLPNGELVDKNLKMQLKVSNSDAKDVSVT